MPKAPNPPNRCLVCGLAETVKVGYLCLPCQLDQPTYSVTRQREQIWDAHLGVWWKWDERRLIWRPYNTALKHWATIPKVKHPKGA